MTKGLRILMKAVSPLLLILLSASPAQAAGVGVLIFVQYQKTGQEREDAAYKLGEQEVANSNPCVLQMRRDLEALRGRPDLRDAVKAVTRTFDDPRPVPRIVLHCMNEAIELRFELWSPPQKYSDGVVYDEGRAVYRKAVFVTSQSGSWQQRLDGDQCHVSDVKFTALLDEV